MLKMLLGIYLDFAINDAVPGLKSVNALNFAQANVPEKGDLRQDCGKAKVRDINI